MHFPILDIFVQNDGKILLFYAFSETHAEHIYLKTITTTESMKLNYGSVTLCLFSEIKRI